MKNIPLTPLPFHFKTPGRSYSQIGRKGNVALYAVYSDYFSLPDFALPYLLIGYELIVIKTNRNGVERYPAPWQFGHCAWSIPKASKRFGRTRSRMCRSIGQKLRISKSKKVLNRSATSEESTLMAPTEFGTTKPASQADQTASESEESVTALSPKRLAFGETVIANHSAAPKRGGGGYVAPPAGIARPVKLSGKNFMKECTLPY
jgi:hypothetical protein